IFAICSPIHSGGKARCLGLPVSESITGCLVTGSISSIMYGCGEGGGGSSGGRIENRAAVSFGTIVLHGYQYRTGNSKFQSRTVGVSNAARRESSTAWLPAKNTVKPYGSNRSSATSDRGGRVSITGSEPPNASRNWSRMRPAIHPFRKKLYTADTPV